MPAERDFALRREEPETGMPFIWVDKGDFAYITCKFPGYLLHTRSRQGIRVRQVYAP